MLPTQRADQIHTLEMAIQHARHCEAEVERLTRQYADAKVALNAQPLNASAARLFMSRGNELMSAMTARYRSEATLADLQKQALPYR